MEFGYLPKSNIETGNLRTEEQLRGAIKNLQVIFLNGLLGKFNVTGFCVLLKVLQNFSMEIYYFMKFFLMNILNK